MFMQLVLQKSLTLVIACALIAGSILTFDNSILFDWLFFGTLTFVALLLHKNVNIVGIILIIVAAKMVDEAGWYLLSDTLLSKGLVYLAFSVTLFIVKEEEYRIPLAILLLLSLLSELYWAITDYSAPEIYWYFFELNLEVLVRHYLFMRVFFTSSLVPNKSKSIELDVNIHDLITLFLFVNGLIILEFLMRHVLTIDIKVMWAINPYILHGLSVYMVYLILNGSAQLTLSSKLNA